MFNNYGYIILILTITFNYSNAGNNSFVLDGNSFNGTIKADGIYGLFGVQGTLSFENGFLFWTVGDSVDKMQYSVTQINSVLQFSASATIENGENIEWVGIYDGNQLCEVKARWTRVKGDFIHDLLLPDILTLTFTPDDMQEKFPSKFSK